MGGRPWISATLALLAAAQTAHAVGPSTGDQLPTAVGDEATNLARDLVSAESDAGSAGNFNDLERFLLLPISDTLAKGQPKLQADLAAKVHELSGLWRKEYTDALVEAYSKNLTASEMRDIIAFLRGPGGRAEAVNLPLLKKNLASALEMQPDAIARMEADSNVAFQHAPEVRRDLIERIFKAQNLEERTRQDFRRFYSTMNSAFAGAESAHGSDDAKGATAKPLYENDEINEHVGADVRRSMAIERSFYLTHYSDDDLIVLANYLESDAGRAVMVKLPAIRRAVTSKMVDKLDTMLPNLIESVCTTSNCSVEQKQRLSHQMNLVEKGMHTALAQ